MARRPQLTARVLASLDALATGTPANDATESGLRYLRALLAAERSEDIAGKRARLAAYVKQYKRARGITKGGKPGRRSTEEESR